VTDPLPAEIAYIAGTLSCQARGTSTVVSCLYDAANRQIIYEGLIAPDFGKLTEQAAANEVVITFRSNLLQGAKPFQNTAYANWDHNGNDVIVDDVDAGQISIDAVADFALSTMVIPTLNAWMLVLLGLLLAASTLYRRKLRQHIDC
jgi:hypothetical protein